MIVNIPDNSSRRRGVRGRGRRGEGEFKRTARDESKRTLIEMIILKKGRFSDESDEASFSRIRRGRGEHKEVF